MSTIYFLSRAQNGGALAATVHDRATYRTLGVCDLTAAHAEVIRADPELLRGLSYDIGHVAWYDDHDWVNLVAWDHERGATDYRGVEYADPDAIN